MDPLTVFSLVANIIQVVDAATIAATSCYQIYKLGASIEDLRLADTSDQLYQCYTTLNSSLQPNQASSPLPCGIDLKSLSAECCDSAQILHKELKALQKSAGEGRRKAFTKFVLRKRKAGKLQMLKERLEENQRTLDTKVLVDVRQTILALSSRQDNQYANLYQTLSKLSENLASCRVCGGQFQDSN